jgi:hypothetical protein
MADIEVKLDDQDTSSDFTSDMDTADKQEKSVKFNIKLKARKTIDGNIIVSDHPDIDIVIMPEKMKVITFAKDNFDDTVYETQNRMFKYLFRKGVLVPDSVCGSNVYGSLEGKIQQPKQEIPIDDLMLMLVGKFIEQEKPSYMYQKSLEDVFVDNVTNPGEENSTELGEVPAATEKGSVPIHQVRRYAYGL